MKKTTKTIAILPLLAMLAVGCQKEGLDGIVPGQTDTETRCMYSLHYIVDGKQDVASFQSYAEKEEFVLHLFDLAEQGYKVEFFNTERPHFVVSSKEVIYFTTTSKDEAAKWSSQMTEMGYSVVISFDEKEMTYKCIAKR